MFAVYGFNTTPPFVRIFNAFETGYSNTIKRGKEMVLKKYKSWLCVQKVFPSEYPVCRFSENLIKCNSCCPFGRVV